MRTRLAAVAVTVVAALSLAACSDEGEPAPPQDTVAGQPAETEPGLPAGPEEGFDGEILNDVVPVGPMEVTVPKGITLPDATIVTENTESHVMMADEDPQAVIDEVLSSAEAAGYEVYAEPNPSQTVLVGHGNAVLFTADPNVQILTWGPEVMKDVLAEGQ